LPPETFGLAGDEPMLELDVYENPFREEIVARPFALVNGQIEIPQAPGLGVEIREEVLRRYLAK
jgi:D-galactarolactone cycloisomerase